MERIFRLLFIYVSLLLRKQLNKKILSQLFNISEHTIEKDVSYLNNTLYTYLDALFVNTSFSSFYTKHIHYDTKQQTYRIDGVVFPHFIVSTHLPDRFKFEKEVYVMVITEEFFNIIIQFLPFEIIEIMTDDKIRIRIKLSNVDAVYLSLCHRSNLKIISPKNETYHQIQTLLAMPLKNRQ